MPASATGTTSLAWTPLSKSAALKFLTPQRRPVIQSSQAVSQGRIPELGAQQRPDLTRFFTIYSLTQQDLLVSSG